MSTTYKILTNPFYAGIIVWNGERHPGKHEAIVTLDEFQKVQELLGRPGRPKPSRHSFPYTGIIRCGVCRLMVTAEHKVNRHGHRYIYYHCTKRRLGPRCPQPSVQAGELERQIVEFIQEISIPRSIEKCILTELDNLQSRTKVGGQAQQQSLSKAVADVKAQLSELTSLRLRNLIDDTEFSDRRRELAEEEQRLQRKALAIDQAADRFEPLKNFVSFSVRAVDCLKRGDDETKRLVLETVGSNLLLKDKRLSIKARKPFMRSTVGANNSRQLAVIDDVRTLLDAQDEETLDTMYRIKALIEKHDAKGRIAA